jgi:WD40 repeat protein
VQVWNSVDGALPASLNAHSNPLRAVGMSADGRVLVSSGLDGKVRLWNATTTGG